MNKQKESALSNARIAIVFFVFLFVIAGISLAFKIVLVVREGKFDDSRRFNLSVSDKNNPEVISFSPCNELISPSTPTTTSILIKNEDAIKVVNDVKTNTTAYFNGAEELF